MKIRLSTAEAVIAEAKETVLAKGLPPMCISVVDEETYLVAFCRMDGAFAEAIDIAHRKARAAALFANGRTMSIEDPTRRDAAASENGSDGSGGGVVLRDVQAEVIGAVGVSGGSAQDEEFVARTAAVAIAG